MAPFILYFHAQPHTAPWVIFVFYFISWRTLHGLRRSRIKLSYKESLTLMSSCVLINIVTCSCCWKKTSSQEMFIGKEPAQETWRTFAVMSSRWLQELMPPAGANYLIPHILIDHSYVSVWHVRIMRFHQSLNHSKSYCELTFSCKTIAVLYSDQTVGLTTPKIQLI